MMALNALFEGRYGGPQKRVIDVGTMLRKHGIETVLLFPFGNGNAPLIAENSGFKVIRLPFTRMPKPSQHWKVLKWLLLLPRDVSKITKRIKALGIDAVHVNGSFFLAPALAAKFTRRPLIWHLNDTIISPWLAKIFGIIVKWLANEVVVAAKAVANHYGMGNHPYTIIYAPVDVKQIRPMPNKRTTNELPLRIGLIANWNPLKGIEVFAKTAAHVQELLESHVEFIVAGARLDSHAGYVSSIDHLVHQYGLDKNFHSLGFIDDVTQFLHSLDVLVLSSWSEACPMAVLEGMAAALPIVATDVGGVRELLGPEGCVRAGYVVPPGDHLQMAEKILELLQRPELRYQMGKYGREVAEQRFSLQACAAMHLKVYQDALGKSEK